LMVRAASSTAWICGVYLLALSKMAGPSPVFWFVLHAMSFMQPR